MRVLAYFDHDAVCCKRFRIPLYDYNIWNASNVSVMFFVPFLVMAMAAAL